VEEAITMEWNEQQAWKNSVCQMRHVSLGWRDNDLIAVGKNKLMESVYEKQLRNLLS